VCSRVGVAFGLAQSHPLAVRGTVPCWIYIYRIFWLFNAIYPLNKEGAHESASSPSTLSSGLLLKCNFQSLSVQLNSERWRWKRSTWREGWVNRVRASQLNLYLHSLTVGCLPSRPEITAFSLLLLFKFFFLPLIAQNKNFESRVLNAFKWFTIFEADYAPVCNSIVIWLEFQPFFSVVVCYIGKASRREEKEGGDYENAEECSSAGVLSERENKKKRTKETVGAKFFSRWNKRVERKGRESRARLRFSLEEEEEKKQCAAAKILDDFFLFSRKK